MTARPLLRRPSVLIAIAVANLALIGWIWMRQDVPEEIPASMLMSPAQFSATPDFALIHMTFSDLNMKVIANPANIPHWRSLPDAARNALVLTWVEERFPGFSGVLIKRQSGPFHFQADDLAQAYDAIGATGVAEVVREAGRRAQELPGSEAEQPKAWTDLDARFADARRRSEVQRVLRAYIRTHAEAISAAKVSS